MIPRSLRTRFALFTAVLVMVALALFAGLSTALFYHEQMDAFSEDHTVVPSKRDRREAAEGVFTLLSCYAVLLPLNIAAAGGVAWVCGRRFLRHLNELTEAADRVTIQNLHERIPLSGTDDEVTRLTAAFNDLLERLERSVTQIQRFSADASHEFRMPLTLMKCEVENLLRESVHGELTETCERLLLDLHRLNATCDSLLFLTRADAGAIRMVPQAVPFSELCEEVVDDVAALAERQGITVDRTLPGDVKVWGDATLIRRVLLNLLDNALKHNRIGGWIRISGAHEADTVALRIQNSGTPIAREHRQRIFERFYRVDPSRSRHTGGAGLGLSICREIVALHGGELCLEENGESHTSFLAKFPLVPPCADGPKVAPVRRVLATGAA